ncbi:TRAP transporter substrate-binding protein [Gallibacterium salpingitidis]|uniref:TRAP transporter substrate-binding protein n=1 Tax=Gallibacterium salpingitidis TaxID=505341 RepID=UPI00266F5B72|nr:TRAP transporter substrate-binding protein [Gallibacterium salpingitidis]WKS99167.1 TRAP transporter substrate-binding protein [Gallibacterium salpingitidis]
MKKMTMKSLLVMGVTLISTNVSATVLRLAHHMTTDNVNHILVSDFSEKLKEISSGNLTVDIYPNGILGGQVELFEGMKLGTVDMSISDTSIIGSYYPPIGILDLPYIFKDRDTIKKLFSSNIMKPMIDEITVKSGVRLLSIQPVAYRNIILKNPLKSSNDFSGIKIRTPNSPTLVDTIKHIGATPNPIPSGEAYTAIQTGVVDGMEGNPEFLSSIKINEVAKNWYETQHAMTFTALNISESKYQSLSKQEKEWIAQAVSYAVDNFYVKSHDTDQKWRNYLVDKGVIFNSVDLTLLKEKTAGMVNDFINKYNLQELYKEISQ